MIDIFGQYTNVPNWFNVLIANICMAISQAPRTEITLKFVTEFLVCLVMRVARPLRDKVVNIRVSSAGMIDVREVGEIVVRNYHGTLWVEIHRLRTYLEHFLTFLQPGRVLSVQFSCSRRNEENEIFLIVNIAQLEPVVGDDSSVSFNALTEIQVGG